MALTVPFTEDFSGGFANWVDNASSPVTHHTDGGPDNDAYISSEVPFTAANPMFPAVITFRANNALNASDDAFVGNWISGGVGQVTAYMRSYGTDVLSPIARISGSGGAFVVESRFPLLPGAWTPVTFNIDENSPLLTMEFGSFNGAIGAVNNLTFGVGFPPSLGSDDTVRTFDLDRARIRVPEPGSAGLILVAISALSACWRRRSS